MSEIPTVSPNAPQQFIQEWVNKMETGFSNEMFR